jgi:methylmalonyl-CoA mutase
MEKLFSEFTSTNAQDWKEQIIKDLKGIDFNTLIWKTNSGIDVKPFYTSEDVQLTNELNAINSDWSICEYIQVDDEVIANAKALNALQNGASGLVFKISKKTNFQKLCNGILFEYIYSLFEISIECEEDLIQFLKSKNYEKHCFIDIDETVKGKLNVQHFNSKLSINTSIYNESGATSLNQLAFSIAHINEYLTELEALNKLKELQTLHITVAIGGDFFMEISKVRALRNLTNFLLKQYDCNPEIHIHAQTTLVNKTQMDMYNNLLRSTTETMSASIGGANSIVVFPFDYHANPDNDFSSRMSRNQQLILKDESYLNKVSDIAAGSYYIETITKTLCEKAWDIFKDIEAKGGLINSLKLNYIQTIINSDAQQLITDFNEGKLILVGVNKFQNKSEEPKTSIHAHIENVTQSLVIQPIKALRLA